MRRPTSRSAGTNNTNNNGGLQVGIADDQAKDFDFGKTEMKYDSTGMFHWSPARNLEDCILVRNNVVMLCNFYISYHLCSTLRHYEKQREAQGK